MAHKMTKKEIVNEIEKTFREHPTIEVVAKDMGLRNKRWGLHGYCLCWVCNTIMVRPYSTSVNYWYSDLMKLKKAQLATIMERTWGEI